MSKKKQSVRTQHELDTLDSRAAADFSMRFEGLQPTVFPPLDRRDLIAALRSLREEAFAGGNALVTLLWMATVTVELLQRIALEKPELLKPYARQSTLWPVLASTTRKIAAKNAELLAAIELGADAAPDVNPLNLGLKVTVARKWACGLLRFIVLLQHYPLPHPALRCTMEEFIAKLLEPRILHFRLNLPIESAPTIKDFSGHYFTPELQAAARDLPPFSDDKTALDRWWEVAKKLLMLNTDGHPETIDELSAIGAYNKKHASALKKVELTSLDEEESVLSEGSAAAAVRAAIFKRLKKEFRSIALNLPKSKLSADRP